jgi:hypothetical protein
MQLNMDAAQPWRFFTSVNYLKIRDAHLSVSKGFRYGSASRAGI